MQIHELKRNTSNRKSRRVGRGGKRGKTSGKGHKGQKARAGRKLRPEMRDIIKKIPKKRGYRFASIQIKPEVVNVASLDSVFEDGREVTPKILLENSLIRRKKGKIPQVKILGNGEISKKIKISGCMISESAKQKIEKAGGSVVEQRDH